MEALPATTTSAFANSWTPVALARLTEETRCPVCFGILKRTVASTVCLHRFCASCIDTCLAGRPPDRKDCPVCRTNLHSRRALRPDPTFDLLLKALYGDVILYGQQEDALVAAQNEAHAVETVEEQAARRAQRQAQQAAVAACRPNIHRRSSNASNEAAGGLPRQPSNGNGGALTYGSVSEEQARPGHGSGSAAAAAGKRLREPSADDPGLGPEPGLGGSSDPVAASPRSGGGAGGAAALLPAVKRRQSLPRSLSGQPGEVEGPAAAAAPVAPPCSPSGRAVRARSGSLAPLGGEPSTLPLGSAVAAAAAGVGSGGGGAHRVASASACPGTGSRSVAEPEADRLPPRSPRSPQHSRPPAPPPRRSGSGSAAAAAATAMEADGGGGGVPKGPLAVPTARSAAELSFRHPGMVVVQLKPCQGGGGGGAASTCGNAAAAAGGARGRTPRLMTPALEKPFLMCPLKWTVAHIAQLLSQWLPHRGYGPAATPVPPSAIRLEPAPGLLRGSHRSLRGCVTLGGLAAELRGEGEDEEESGGRGGRRERGAAGGGRGGRGGGQQPHLVLLYAVLPS